MNLEKIPPSFEPDKEWAIDKKEAPEPEPETKEEDVKIKNKIRTIGPDGTFTESKTIKESIEKVRSLDRQ